MPGIQQVSRNQYSFAHHVPFCYIVKVQELIDPLHSTDIPVMALPPCHMFCQFYVTLPSREGEKPKLSCLMYQRSADLGLGIPFNIASYAALTHMMARVTGTEAYELIMQLGDAHVYRDHIDALQIQITREPRPFPKLRWAREVEDIDDFKFEDFIVEGYKPHPKLEMKMSV